MRKHIAVIDCAITAPSARSYNKLQSHFKDYFFSYHHAPLAGLETLAVDDLLSAPDGYIIFGSHSDVYLKLDWHAKIVEFIKPKIAQGLPVLGICFGHQLMADAYGLTVDRVPQENYVHGSSVVTLLKNFGHLKTGATFRTGYANNFEVKNLNDQFIHLGRSNVCEYNVIALKNSKYVGIQSHPEAARDFFMLETPLDENSELVTKTMQEGYGFLEAFFEFFKTKKINLNNDAAL